MKIDAKVSSPTKEIVLNASEIEVQNAEVSSGKGAYRIIDIKDFFDRGRNRHNSQQGRRDFV